jgi:multidrug resistance efflux pump
MTALEARHAHAVTQPNTPPPARRAWAAWLLVIVIAAGAVFAGHWLIEKRHQAATTMVLDSAVLGAQQIPVGPADAATVASVQVVAGDLVRAGQTLAQLAVASDDPASTGAGILLAPADGVIVSVDRPAGSVVKAGEPVVTEYSSASLSFVANVAVVRAQKLRLGMAVSISGPGLSAPIAATVGAAQPNLNGSTPNVIDVALIPNRLSDVRGLVPGLAFRATVTLTDYPANAASVLGVGP